MTKKEKKTKDPITLWTIYRRIFPLLLKGAPGLFCFNHGLAIVHGAGWAFLAVVTQFFFDTVANGVAGTAPLSAVLWATAALGGIHLATQALNGVSNFSFGMMFSKMEGFIFERIHQKTARIDATAYEDPSLLDDINKAKKGGPAAVRMADITCILFSFYLPYFIFMGIYLFRLQPILSLSLVAIFIPTLAQQLVRVGIFSKLEDESAPIRREYEYYEKAITDREYFKETRILGAFGFFKSLYKDSLALLNRKIWKTEKKTTFLELSMRMLTLVGYMGVLALMFRALMQGQITVGAFAAVFASLDMLFGIMSEVMNHIGGITREVGTVRNFIRFMELPERSGKLQLPRNQGITLKNAGFRYPGAESDSLIDIDLTVEPGETIAVVGENGAGKSTLVRLMTGMYNPTQGSVKIGDVETREAAPETVYEGVSAVFQKYQRYKLTLDENVRIGDMEAEGEIADAVEKADLAMDDAFPQKYETMLSREFEGVDLSGGQWQRVALARGFYRTHDMIVLDEPTAAIDPIEETKLYQKFADISQGKTSVIVTHRLGSAKIADRIVVMDKGRIDAIGSHDELMKQNGKYAQMYHAQAQWYVTEDEETLSL